MDLYFPAGDRTKSVPALSRRYMHHIAISTERLISLADGVVTFAVRNNNDGGSRKKLQHLPAGLFIQRSMSHVLPQGLKRIRHYGLLATATSGKSWRFAVWRWALPNQLRL